MQGFKALMRMLSEELWGTRSLSPMLMKQHLEYGQESQSSQCMQLESEVEVGTVRSLNEVHLLY